MLWVQACLMQGKLRVEFGMQRVLQSKACHAGNAKTAELSMEAAYHECCQASAHHRC